MKTGLINLFFLVFLCASVAHAQHFVFDNFNRPNGSLGDNWSTPVGVDEGGGNSSARIEILNNSFAPSSLPGRGALSVWTGLSFNNDKWAQATISAIAPFTSIVAITACTSSLSTSTYAYTLTSGAALISTQQIYVTGMTNSANNSPRAGFIITSLGSGTFSVSNASPGSNETGSSGTGKSPSDSNVGVAVRATSNGQNGYFLSIGTNSGSVGKKGVPSDHRVYDVELWKVESGTDSFLADADTPISAITDQVGDAYTLAAIGTGLYVYHNGKLVITYTDTSLTSGSPGIFAWSVGGAGEWAAPTTYATGNSGTQWTNFAAGDFTATAFPYFDNFIAANNTDLHAYNSNWVENSGTMQSFANAVTYTALVSNNALASWQGATFANDQWAQITLASVFTSTSDIGPAVRVGTSALTGYFYRQNSGNTRVLYKVVAGTYTLLATSSTAHTNAQGDTLRLVVVGTSVRCYLNGTLENFGAITDSAITSGFPGIEGSGSGTKTTGSAWQAGNAGLSGFMGISGVTVNLGGAGSGTTTSSSPLGIYSFSSGIADGTYTVTPSLTGYTFSPSSLSVVVVGGTLFQSGENFVAAAGRCAPCDLSTIHPCGICIWPIKPTKPIFDDGVATSSPGP